MSGVSRRGVFLSYRREDAAPYARLLQSKLSERFPDAHVFVDMDSIKPGRDFAEVIKEALNSSVVLVALIGRQWGTLTDEAGNRRLDKPDDFVRFEVQTALESDVRVIPVLVDGAKPLQAQDLPSELRKLARLHALELSYDRLEYDAGRLLDRIREVREEAGLPVEDAASPPTSSSSVSGVATHRPAWKSWLPPRRFPGDLSTADTRMWAVISGLAIVAAYCFWAAYLAWPNHYDESPRWDLYGHIVFPCFLACAVIAICSMTEGYYLFVRHSRGAPSGREVLQITEPRPIPVLHQVREIVSYVAVGVVLVALLNYRNTDTTWVVGLSLLALFAFISGISRLRQGDVLYLAGVLLFIASAFLPVSNYGARPGIHVYGWGRFEIVWGLLMVGLWWFKAPHGALIAALVVCLLPLAAEFSETQYYRPVGLVVGSVGIAIAFIAWVLGAGRQLNLADETVKGTIST